MNLSRLRPTAPSLFAPALGAVLALTLAACGGSATDSADGSSEGDAGGESTESVTVEHAMGSTEVPCTPQTVVTLGQGQTDSVLAMGVTPAGVVEPWTDDWYPYLPDEVEQAEVLGTELEPDLERIAALQPDLILGSKLRHEAFYSQLSEIAPTVFSETIGVAWKDNVSLWAEALCRPEEGERVLSAYEERAAALSDKLADANQTDTEVSIVRFMPDQVRIYLTGFPGSVVRDAGLGRPEPQQVEDWESSEQLIEISEERIPEMDGDVIFVMVSSEHYAQQGNQTVDEQMDRWTSTDLWQGLDAVQKGNVVEVDEAHWNLGGGILAANEMLGDLEDHFLGDGGR
ncbi:ABC transporter substrate-binding protein [Ornithinicoccus halotolerans]|uniref:ABC transporter substrate-binding protein n=1 Tax=Ornithinicoccus halotolerans TaxID=1748220 RepID=UPI001296845F|nr:iron-siderophore ABC transporter substrate-binding protein [Ornithinicoccus halotolerans]